MKTVSSLWLCDKTTFMQRIRQKRNIRRGMLIYERISEVNRLKNNGTPPEEIAKRLKLAVSTVYRYMRCALRE